MSVLTPFIQDGKLGFFSDLVLAITIHDFHNLAFPAFLKANRARLHEDPDLKGWVPPGHPNHVQRGEYLAPAGTVLLTFSRPPLGGRGSFVVGRDPRTCDVVLDSPYVSAQHVRIGFGRYPGLVIEDVSENGVGLVENGRRVLWDPPAAAAAGTAGGDRPPSPRSPADRTEMLVPGFTYDLQMPAFRMQFKVPERHGHEMEVYERKRRAFVAARGMAGNGTY